jgi:cell division protease FtsH
LLNNIAILLGGRAAEEIALQHMTTGAGNDLERATTLARKMVCEWGMSDSMGPLSYGKKEEAIFLGREIAQHRDYSENTAIEIDKEVKRIVMDNYHRARTLIQEREPVLHRLANALLEKETLDAVEIDAIINAQPVAA